MGKCKYTTVCLPVEFTEQVLSTTNNLEGYRSLSEFVRDAIRRRLEEIKLVVKDDGERPETISA